MDGNEELLNYIHQNSEMGIGTIQHLLEITKDEKFKKTLDSQKKEYEEINIAATEKLKERNKAAKDISAFAKASSNVMIDWKTLADKSASHISQMMIQGSTMGIIEMTKKLKEYDNADSDIVELANKLLQFEQKNVEECKRYLH